MTYRIDRCWINQPSKFDPWHKWHGTNVLVAYDYQGYEAVAFFLDSDIVSMPIRKSAVSNGWRYSHERL